MADRTWGSAIAAAGFALLLAGGMAIADTAQERIFSLSVLDGVATGDRIVFDHARTVGIVTESLPPITDGRVEVVLVAAGNGGREARVTLIEAERQRHLNPFPAGGGHPLLMVFMETAVRDMTALTGGSPFYIRNRMRDAVRNQDDGAPVDLLYQGRTIMGERFRFRPFADDPNRERMGPFADLEISFVISDDVPGTFAAMSVRTPPGDDGDLALAESMVLRGLRISD